jgi:hypothetical protein
VRPDGDANERIYHKKISAEDIIFKHETPVPPAARPMVSYLNQKARRNQSELRKRRSLQMCLQPWLGVNEGSSFQHVLEEARHQLARHYLNNSVLELK